MRREIWERPVATRAFPTAHGELRVQRLLILSAGILQFKITFPSLGRTLFHTVIAQFKSSRLSK